jgi:hypothetical protein
LFFFRSCNHACCRANSIFPILHVCNKSRAIFVSLPNILHWFYVEIDPSQNSEFWIHFAFQCLSPTINNHFYFHLISLDIFQLTSAKLALNVHGQTTPVFFTYTIRQVYPIVVNMGSLNPTDIKVMNFTSRNPHVKGIRSRPPF